jgi:ribosomal protein S18 acetylase RimI-like enzyme
MIIRNATSADAEALTELSATTMREAFGPPLNPMEWVNAYINEAMTLPAIQQELAESRCTFFVMESETGEMVGYAKVRRKAPPRRMPERNALEIQRIYLLKSHIGGGRGKQLMDHCLVYAQQQGFRAVYLGVWERNERAIRFYEQQGFKPFGWHVFQFGPDRQRDIWMRTEL